MPVPSTAEEFLHLVEKSGVVDRPSLEAYLRTKRPVLQIPELADSLVRDGLVTQFQAQQFLQGRFHGFILKGKYKLLEHLGSGGMAAVYLCEQIPMRRRVALKILPAAMAKEAASLERFYREARALGALNHPNTVRAYDLDNDRGMHFLVMEYVDGCSLETLISQHGPLEVLRAAHYIHQAACGLESAHQAGLVHRDIKPGNLLLDRHGTVKLLDLGLARFFNDTADDLSHRFKEKVVGTADYLAPEQAMGSTVDIRADIYSLGATFYYLLTGRTPFGAGSVTQKLIWHQTRAPKPIRSFRPEVPEGLEAIVQKMMAKEPAQRYTTPAEVVEALVPWTVLPVPPPSAKEMPNLSLAAMANLGEEPGRPDRQTMRPAGKLARRNGKA